MILRETGLTKWHSRALSISVPGDNPKYFQINHKFTMDKHKWIKKKYAIMWFGSTTGIRLRRYSRSECFIVLEVE